MLRFPTLNTIVDKISHEDFHRIVQEVLISFYDTNDIKLRYDMGIEETLGYFTDPMVFDEDKRITQVNDVGNDLYNIIFDIFHGANQQNGCAQDWDIEDEVARKAWSKIERQMQYNKLEDAGVDEDLHGVIDI